MVDHYAILGVDEHADQVQIRRAWRRLSQRSHPDRAGDAGHAVFISGQEAYRVLSNPVLRLEYDLARAAFREKDSVVPPAQSSFDEGVFSVQSEPVDLSVVHLPVTVGDVAHAVVRVPLRAVIRGVEIHLRKRTAYVCPSCGGHGSGCHVCLGTGQLIAPRIWRVQIPPGMVDRGFLRLRSQGHRGGPHSVSGDLVVQVRWTWRHGWRWEDGRLCLRRRVSPGFLRNGGPLRFRAPDGQVGIAVIPPVGADRIWLRIPGIGLPRGDVRDPAWLELSVRQPWFLR